MNEITTVGVDLAKDVIVVCGADARGRVVLRKQLSFAAFGAWAANLPLCVMGMEACSSAHHWARRLRGHGHDARLMAAEFVGAFRMSRGAKNDSNDAEAILIAVQQPTMRFVSVKSVDDQATLAWHRVRSGFMRERKSLLNRTRGLLSEFGIWASRSSAALVRKLPELMDEPSLPESFKPILLSQRIQKICGIGALTASAIVATIANACDYRNGRQLSAWAGLVPRQDSSGGKSRLGKITKRGDSYLRGLLTQGARSTLLAALRRAPHKRTRLEHWIIGLRGRVGYHKCLVAIANKHLRMIWAILVKGEAYDANAWKRHQRAAVLN